MTIHSAREAMAIVEACRDFLRNYTPLEHYEVRLDGYTADFARLVVIPTGQLTDNATCYMQRADDAWTVLGLGTFFEPSFFEEHGFPAELRPES